MKSTKLGGAFLDEKCTRLPEKELYNMNKTKETPQKGGYGIGLQVNVVIFLGVTLMIAILMSFIGYRSYNTMIEDGIREKYNEVGMKTAAIETRYTAIYQSGQDLRSRVQQILSLPPEQRNRDDLIAALRSTVSSNDDIVGSGICFEPNAFDGKDAAFVNSPASDATGRAIPYAGKEGSDIVITPLAGYETDEWYQSPRKTQKITLTDPYWYDVTPTQRTYMLTIAFPLIEDGRFVGAVTVDFDAAPFQSDMAAISTPNNFFAVFTPQGTLLAHGLKDDAVSKNVYEMLGVSESEGQKFFGQELFSMERTSESTGLPTTYIFNPIKLKGIETARGELMLDHYLAMNSGTVFEEVPGIETTEPAFGLPALWIAEDQREQAELNGYTVVDAVSVLATHLTEVIKMHAAEILGRQETQNLLDILKKTNPALVDEVVPEVLVVGEVQKVLANLLAERVSIRDMETILEVLSDYGRATKDTDILTEYVRHALARQISQQYVQNNVLPCITLDPGLENKIAGAVQRTEHGSYVSLDPDAMQRLLASLNAELPKLTNMGYEPIVLTSPAVRTYFRQLVERSVQGLVVLSHAEIEQTVELQILGTVRI